MAVTAVRSVLEGPLVAAGAFVTELRHEWIRLRDRMPVVMVSHVDGDTYDVTIDMGPTAEANLTKYHAANDVLVKMLQAPKFEASMPAEQPVFGILYRVRLLEV